MAYVKTAAGRREIEDRALRLPAVLRSILLVIDGRRGDAELEALVTGLRGPADALAQLVERGLIEREAGAGAEPGTSPAATAGVALSTDAERYLRLYEWMSETVRLRLGLKGYFMQLKIERCGDAEALRGLWPEMAAALGKSHGPSLAERWLQESEQLMAIPKDA